MRKGTTMTSKAGCSIRPSGDGYELLDAEGNVIAWMLDEKWAWRILVALEFVEGAPSPSERNRF
jgi:hypothetical protein